MKKRYFEKWETESDESNPYVIHGLERICTMEGRDHKAFRDARLIAASPELLRAAKNLVTYADNDAESWEWESVNILIGALRDAIERAEK